MPNSLKTKLSKLRYQSKITDEEYKELIDKLEGHDEAITAQIMWERDIAIEQLKLLGYGLGEKVEPCEDYISRKMAIEAIEEIQPIDTAYDCTLYDEVDVIYILHSLPSVTPQQKWIPCSERLPEEGGCYLVTTKWKGSYSGDVYIETNMAVYRKQRKEWDCVDVIAWMPLPQSYKAEMEGEE